LQQQRQLLLLSSDIGRSTVGDELLGGASTALFDVLLDENDGVEVGVEQRATPATVARHTNILRPRTGQLHVASELHRAPVREPVVGRRTCMISVMVVSHRREQYPFTSRPKLKATYSSVR